MMLTTSTQLPISEGSLLPREEKYATVEKYCLAIKLAI